MALREFTASDGRQWRVWDVTPETMHPTTRSEDFLAPYLEGWLVFESLDGSAKCRLHPIPNGWSEAADEELEEMLHRSESIRGERVSGPHGRTAIEEREAERIGARESVPGARTFRYPGGRHWSVSEWTSGIAGDSGTMRRVLRFSAGVRSLDLASWPSNWQSYSDDQLAELLVRSFPRTPKPNPTSYRRRAGD
ncbi:MAG: hypothetical protein HOQ11_13410 [Gemmatimonadaceae bacterium]|nr:hypothetical protein [Gemmatimonadaceae bacterium]NUQ94098.1 hypothetical protein [Gemmatimonadaceae bacterium]NUR18006.1 hypothetical protein [Gemmatimonadaceae bacterium]NUS98397.1 hypothetical protein [Gemmatimonadaceae bacterium]